MPQYGRFYPPRFPRDQVIVRGIIEGTATKRRAVFFKDVMLLVKLKSEDHQLLRAQAEPRVGKGWRMPPKVAVGPAIYKSLDQFQVGKEVEIVFSLGDEVGEYFTGSPIVGVDKIQPM